MKMQYQLKCPTCFAESKVTLDDRHGPPELYCMACVRPEIPLSLLRITDQEKPPKPNGKKQEA